MILSLDQRSIGARQRDTWCFSFMKIFYNSFLLNKDIRRRKVNMRSCSPKVRPLCTHSQTLDGSLIVQRGPSAVQILFLFFTQSRITLSIHQSRIHTTLLTKNYFCWKNFSFSKNYFCWQRLTGSGDHYNFWIKVH